MSRLLVLQHLARERPGLFAKVAKERGFTVCTFRLDLGDSLPELRNGDLLLVLGGPMGIRDLGTSTYGKLDIENYSKEFVELQIQLDQIQNQATQGGMNLPRAEQTRYQQFVNGFQDLNSLREKLGQVSDHLSKFAPNVDELYATPEHETDWHDRLLSLGLSALASGITNTLTIGSGRGEIFGAWKGLGVEEQGHNLGHMDQPDNPIWIKIRQYNSRMLVKIMETLDTIPEGSGSMMDHTLIVYTSNNADKQHTNGANWPVMLLGNFDGAFKTGCFTQIDGKRPINSLYTTLLQTAGSQCERFNMSDSLARTFDTGNGVLGDILA